MRKRVFAVSSLILALLLMTVISMQFVYFAEANPDGIAYPTLAMPVEYINYTITSVNGTLWAKIDGIYPIYMIKEPGCALPDALPMVYPTPPGTTNIRVWLNDKELGWSDYSEIDPTALHYTAIGDWSMIFSVLSPVTEFFNMRIHYEHPLEIVNGSYIFLYDLNISPYLSPNNNSSTAYFTILIETESINLEVYATGTNDGTWRPMNFMTNKEGKTETVKIEMHSQLDKPLLGDLVIMFSDPEIPEIPLWIIPPLLAIAIIGSILLKFKRKSTFQIRINLSNVS